MRLRPITWFVLSLMLFVAAAVVWHLSDEWQAKKNNPASSNQSERPAQPEKIVATNATNSVPSSHGGWLSNPLAAKPATIAAAKARFPHRLSNTTKDIDELAQKGKAVLLQNALIDTETPTALPIPAQLRSQGDPGSYVVQSRGLLDDAFRALLRQAGAEIIAYIPNDAYLVRASAGSAQRLANQPQTQTVLPFEPYYKLDESLLKLAVEQQPLRLDTRLNLVLFPGERANAGSELARLGVEIISEDRSPFGLVLTVRPPVNSLVALAGLPAVQGIEMYHERKLANDLSRVRVGVSPDMMSATNNYLGLTGTNILVNVNDSGVDKNHPDLAPRVSGDAAAISGDPRGHGTHVAGTIISSGANSPPGTNASGSVDGANFHGMAPQASVFALPIDNLFGPASDTYLQERAAQTNAFISNNSWNYTGANGYNIAASSYDAAVRDALPGVTGSQPLLFVFSAGNAGVGNDSGSSGESDSITSPATAKNVITVGAIEQLRGITNEVIRTNYTAGGNTVETNKEFLRDSDSDSQVARFSSRGNVGIGLEGDKGRFKPDVVAPGTFVVSTRSTQWDTAAYYDPTNNNINLLNNLVVQPGEFFINTIFVQDNDVQLRIFIFPNVDSPVPFPDLPIYVKQSGDPDTSAYDLLKTNQVSLPPDLPLTPKGTWHYRVGNPTEKPVSFNLVTVLVRTFDSGNYFQVLSNLNEALGPYYRYESGTSMAAPAVSGTLALMQEFFERNLQLSHSPALMKALLINGARSVGTPNTPNINYQGWGLINLQNSLPSALTNYPAPASSLQFFDQSREEALATGQSKTRQLTLTQAGQTKDLRVTLVWTDPPGNPAASLKLVNDLDLIVSNRVTGEVFYGNDFPAGEDFTQPADTNAPPNRDLVNNVENVYLPQPLGSNYTVTVVARRVNVNAVTAQTNNVKQDYALVISSGNGEFADAITMESAPFSAIDPTVSVTFVTNNGVPLLNQRVGANSALSVTTNGFANQWNFYVFTNNTFTNVAFITFLPPDLSIPRLGTRESDLGNATRLEADIDLYVSTDSSLTNLNPAVIAGAVTSRSRGGTETIVFTNAEPNRIYYVGVKSEDQLGAEYGFLGVSSELPFSTRDEDDNLIVRGFPVPTIIPDGTSTQPGGTFIFGIAAEPIKLRRVVVTNTITHEKFGDLLGNLSHGSNFVVLNNHRGAPPSPPFLPSPGPYTFIYDDSQEGTILGATTSDGPGSLRKFVGEEGLGQWLLTMVDNSEGSTGRVDGLTLRLEPHKDTNSIIAVIQGQRFFYDFIDVPPEATNLTVSVGIISGNTPVELYLRRGSFPTRTLFDKSAVLNPPGGSLSIGLADSPPLNAGRYYIGVFNPSLGPVTVSITTTLGLGLAPANEKIITSVGAQPILDDAVTIATSNVTNDSRIVSAQVSLSIDHPRVSDLVLTLISPRGTRVLLAENRGGASTEGYGGVTYTTNFFPTQQSGMGTNAVTNSIGPVPTSGTLFVDFTSFFIPDDLRAYYEGVLILDTTFISVTNGMFFTNYGPGLATVLDIVVNEGGNPNDPTGTNNVWQYTAWVATGVTNYVTFTENTNLATTPIKFAPPPFSIPNYTGTNAAFSNGIYFLPEESLEVLKSEAAQGDWKLEILDNRADKIGRLLSWSLDLVFENVVPVAVPLFHAIPVTNSIAPFATKCFFVDVPIWARFATNTLAHTNGTLNLLFNQDGLPGNGLAGDIPLLTSGPPGGSITLATNSAPPLLPGQRYYLCVQNPDPSNVTFSIEVDFDITTLTNAVSLTSVIDALLIPRYFQFDVSTNAAAVAFEILDASGNVDLVVRRGPPLPDLNSFDYGGFNPGTNNEAIVVFKNSFPVPLTSGRWYLGVFNVDTNAVTYSIRATEFTNAEPVIIGYQVISNSFCITWSSIPSVSYYVQGKINLNDPVWNPASPTIVATGTETTYCIPLPTPNHFFQVVRGEAPVIPDPNVPYIVPGNSIRYFYVEVPTWANFATNTLLTATGPLNLFFNQNGLPIANTNAGDFALLSNITSGSATLATNGTPPLVPGQRYFLGVQNTNTANSPPVTFRLQVEFDITALFDGVPVTSDLPFGPIPRYFQFDVSTNALAVAFQILNASGNVDLVVRQSPPLPNLAFFDYGSFNPGTNNEAIGITTGSAPVPLTPGPWYLSVFNFHNTNVTYTIRATEITNTDPVVVNVGVISNSFCVTWRSVPGVSYLVQGITNLSDTNWTTVSPTITAVDLETSYCLPLPSRFHFFRVVEGSLPANPVFLILSSGVTSNAFCLTWQSIPTLNYLVQGKAGLNDPGWTTVSPTITAVDVETTYCVPLPSPYHFFRVVQGSLPPAVSFSSITVDTNGVLLQWTAPPSQQFQVEWTPTLIPPAWNTFTNIVTSATGNFSFLDDGLQTGGLGATRFYRLRLYP